MLLEMCNSSSGLELLLVQMIGQAVVASNLKSCKSNFVRLIATRAAFKAGLLLRAKDLFRKYKMFSCIWKSAKIHDACNSSYSFSRKRRSSPSNPDQPEDAADSEWTDVETRVSQKGRRGYLMLDLDENLG